VKAFIAAHLFEFELDFEFAGEVAFATLFEAGAAEVAVIGVV
jgi:hypothetical protein